MLNMIRIRFLEYRQNILVLFIMTAMSLVFTYTFGVGFNQGNKQTVIVVDKDGSKESETLIKGLIEADSFDIKSMEYDEAISELQGNQAIAVVVIPKDYYVKAYNQKASLKLIKTGTLMEHTTLRRNLLDITERTIGNYAFISQIEPIYSKLEIPFDGEKIYSRVEETYEHRPMIEIENLYYDSNAKQGYDSLKQSFMGFILFFSSFTMIFCIGSIVEDKQNRVWHRQLVSTIKNSSILGSVLIVGLVIGFIQISFMIVSGKFIFNINLGSNLLALFLIVGGYIAASVSLGLLVSGLVKTEAQLAAMTPLIVVSTSMIGGCMWPLEMVTNPIIRGLSVITPQRWAMEGMESIIVYDGGIGDIKNQLLRLGILTCVFFILAIIPYRKRKLV